MCGAPPTAGASLLPLAEIAVDLRQAVTDRLPEDLAKAVKSLADSPDANPERHVYLDEFKPYRDCLIWDFNRLFWQHLADWEAASGKGFEAALPAGSSDANHPDAVAASARDFLARVQALDAKGQCPHESLRPRDRRRHRRPRRVVARQVQGARRRGRREVLSPHALPARRLLADQPRAGARRRGAPWRPRERRAARRAQSLPVAGAVPLKIIYVHSTNTYDNLPFDDIVRRDGKLYLVEVRAYLNGAAVDGLVTDFGFSREELPEASKRLLDGGPYAVFRDERGVEFWRRLWDAFKLEERLLALDDRDDAHVPPGLRKEHLEDLLSEAPDDVRFHISRGAGESFANTLPLLHPRGYLEVQDIFVSDMDDYRKGFRGPGKLDGSLVTWVNGALLRAVGARAGYDVHFAPFPYRPGTRTTILYTTQRD